MRRIDSVLIDRVFQPIVDGLASVVSCYALAAFILTGAGLCFTAEYLHEGSWLALAVMGPWLSIRIFRAHRLDKERQRTVMSNERVTEVFARLWFLSLQILVQPRIVFSVKGDIWIVVEDLAWWMLVAGLYLMACRRPPPAEQSAQQPWLGWLSAAPVAR